MIDLFANAISAVESGGNYKAIGPVTPKGNRAYGRYQVMDFNIGPWTEKYLGRRLTPDEYLASPEAQDAVFRGEFGSYVDQYGNPQDAASVWFSGRPMAAAGNDSDGYNTVPQYVTKFNNALGSAPMGLLSMSTSGMPEQQPKGLLERIGLQRRDPNATGETAQPFYQRESFGNMLSELGPALMMMDPSTRDAGVAFANINAVKGEKKADAEKTNRTIEWMRSQAAQYPQLVPLLGAMETGSIDVGSAVNTAFQIIQDANKPQDPMAAINLEKAQIELQRLKEGADLDPNVQSSAMLPDQSGVVITMRNGALQVRTVAGEILSGQAATDFVRKAQEQYTDSQRSIYGARREGTLEADIALGGDAAAAAASGAEIGKAQGAAQASAPSDIAAAESTLGYIQSLKDHPGRLMGTGASSWAGLLPGSTAKEFQIEVKRLAAGAFMTAIEQLRGMGALSNAEGQTATAAVAALQEDGTEEGFLKRLSEYEAIVQRGLERARGRIAAPAAIPAPAVAAPAVPQAPAASSGTMGGVNWRIVR